MLMIKNNLDFQEISYISFNEDDILIYKPKYSSFNQKSDEIPILKNEKMNFQFYKIE